MRVARVVPFIALLSAAACGGSSSSSITGTNNNSSAPMSATIDGAAWSTPVPQGVYRNSILSIAGIDLGITASVGFAVAATKTGTYSVAYGNSAGGSATITKTGKGWGSALPGGTGSVTITTLTANHAVGTFVFDAVPASGGATGTVHVTDGKFDVTF